MSASTRCCAAWRLVGPRSLCPRPNPARIGISRQEGSGVSRIGGYALPSPARGRTLATSAKHGFEAPFLDFRDAFPGCLFESPFNFDFAFSPFFCAGLDPRHGQPTGRGSALRSPLSLALDAGSKRSRSQTPSRVQPSLLRHAEGRDVPRPSQSSSSLYQRSDRSSPSNPSFLPGVVASWLPRRRPSPNPTHILKHLSTSISLPSLQRYDPSFSTTCPKSTSKPLLCGRCIIHFDFHSRDGSIAIRQRALGGSG